MKLTRDDVLKLAQLARLNVTEDEIEQYAAQLSEILQYVEHLNEVDVTGLRPTNQVSGLTNVSRPDVIKDYGYQSQDLLQQAPDAEADLIKVQRMIG